MALRDKLGRFVKKYGKYGRKAYVTKAEQRRRDASAKRKFRQMGGRW